MRIALAVLSFALFVHIVNAQQDKQQPEQRKFKLARPGAKNVHADEWMVTLDPKLTPDEFERELERILVQYDAKLMPRDPVTNDLFKDPISCWAGIQVPEARARQIAEDEAIVEVFQVFEMESFPREPPPNAVKPAREGVWPLSNRNSEKKSRKTTRP